METLSGYNHLRNPSGEPPVNFSHVTVRIQRTVYHILSRVGDAGIDHTRRSNKIAHHLALTEAEAERFRDGPASLFADHAFWYSEWDQDPETFPGGRVPNAYGWTGSDFSTWTAVFNDPGWAGLLAQATAEGNKPATVIVPQGEDVMELLNEALQLVAPNKRWRVGFSTYFSRLAPGTECQWRFVLDGTGDARKLRSRAPGILIDPMGTSKEPPDDNPFVAAAREGRPQSVHAQSSGSSRRTSGAGTSRRSSGSADGGHRRPTSTVRRRPQRNIPRPTGARQRARENDLEYLEEYDDSPSKARSKPRPGKSLEVRIVIGLAAAVLAILIYVGIQQVL